MTENTILEGDVKKELIAMAVPLLIGNILQQLYNTADSLIIGHFLGTDAFAAVGVAGTIMNLFIFVLNGFCIGLSVIFAQLYGKVNHEAFRREFFVSVSYGSVFTFVLSALFIGIMKPLLHLIQTPDQLLSYVSDYLTIIIAGMITTFFYNLFSSILRSVGNTKAALYFLFTSVIINAIFDYLFVAVFSFGIAGASYATVFAQFISAIFCYFYLVRNYNYLICKRKDIGLHTDLLKKSLSYGFSTAMHQSSLYIGKILVQSAVNTLGTAGIAAYTATMRIEGFANSFGDSGAQAVSVFVSQNYGAENKKRVAEGLHQGIWLLVLLGIVLSVIMFAFARFGVQIFLEFEDTLSLNYGTSYLKIISLFYVLCFIGSAFVGYFRGIGKVSIPLVGTTLHISLRVILSYLLIHKMGLSAVALATGLGWISVVVYQLIVFF